MGDSSTAAIEDCLRCSGLGQLDSEGHPRDRRCYGRAVECPDCNGTGRIATVCVECHEPPGDDVHVVFVDCCEHAHADARNHAAYFATLTPVGVQPDADDTVLLLANHTCGSTIARTVAKGGAEHVAFAQRCKEAA